MFTEVPPWSTNLTYGENWQFAFKLRSMLRGWPEQMEVTRSWCAEMFGEGGPALWGRRSTLICFYDPDQALQFKMRWC
jgi:hypothetical protein